MRWLVLMTGLLLSSPAWSHIRWFVGADLEPVSFGWQTTYIWLIAGGVLYCIIGYIIAMKAPLLDGKNSFFKEWPYQAQWRVISFLTGLVLLLSAFKNEFFAPNINIEIEWLRTVCNIAELIVGATLITTVWPRLSGILLLVTAVFGLIAVDFALWIDYLFEIIGLGFMFYYLHNRPLAIWWLRLGVGAQLMGLAIHNKFIHPELGVQFLQDYNWNFMPMIGFENFNDLAFVFSAGVAELCFGLLIFFGIATRFAVISVSVFFVVTIAMMGPADLFGHLPLIAAAITLISLGSGRNEKLESWIGFSSLDPKPA